MHLYPVFLKLEQVPVLVVGGGAVAERKAGGLLAAGAALTVLSPGLTEGLLGLQREGRIGWRRRSYREGDLAGFTLAIAATSDREANARIRAEGARRGVLVNAVDDPDNCGFFVPAVARRGPLALAVSTSGLSPYLARRLREALEGRLYPGIEADLERLGALRRAAREAGGGEAGGGQGGDAQAGGARSGGAGTGGVEPLVGEILARMGLS